ncbi:MAG: VWA domain-containing protein [Terriglobia bacterium]
MKKSLIHSKESGVVLFYMAALLFVLLAFAGLAVDLGRAYVVKAHLSKAVDGAALAAARMIGNGQTAAQTEANKIFNANFPNGYLGVSSVQNPPATSFQVAADGSNQITVSSTAVMPTTFMKVIGQPQVNVFSSGQAIRRLVDISFVIDKSGSLSAVWGQVQSAAQQFVGYFDQNVDRMAIVGFSGNTIVTDTIRTVSRGFDKATVLSHIAGLANGGNTCSAEGMYQGWDQLRSVTSGNQSSLRIIVFFTDGSPNSFPGTFNVQSSPGVFVSRTGVLFTGDYPNLGSSSTNTPTVTGLYQTYGTYAAQSQQFVAPTDNTYTSGNSSSPYTSPLDSKIPWIPLMSTHSNHVSSGIPTSFVLYDPTLAGQRQLIGQTVNGYPDHVRNANNAARNLLETVANAAKADTTGDFKIRIYALGLGGLLPQSMGSVPETGTSLLKRVANDKTSPDFNSSQLEGKYYYAADPAQLRAAFEAVRNQILRLSM